MDVLLTCLYRADQLLMRRFATGRSRSKIMIMPISESPCPHVTFQVHREEIDEDGYWNPTGDDSFSGGLQINIYGSKSHYLKLAEAIRAFAEIDSSNDCDFHQHFEGIISVDNRTRLHLILRKDDVGNSIHSASFPWSDERTKPADP